MAMAAFFQRLQRYPRWSGAFAGAVFAFGLSAAGAPEALGAEVESVRVWRSPERTRVVFELGEATRHELIRADQAGQLLIDLESATIAASFNDLGGLQFGDGPVTRLAVAEAPPGKIRFVVELAAPVEPRIFALPPVQQYGNRLVLDFLRSL